MFKSKDEDRLISTGETAEMLNVSPAWLERGRCLGYGPPYFKIGRMVKYRVGDLVAYRDGGRRFPGAS